MAQWGSVDNAANSVNWAVSQLNKSMTTNNITGLFGNTTADAYVTGVTSGQFGVGTGEMAGTGGISDLTVTAAGTGFVTLPAAAFSGTNTSVATATVSGTIVGVTANATAVGAGWAVGDSIVINEAGATNTAAPDLAVATVKVGTVALGSAVGTGYAVSDTLTITGTGTEATVNVTAVGGGGELQTLDLLTVGSYTVGPASEEDAAITTDGSGVSGVVNVTVTLLTTTITSGGDFTTYPTTTSNNDVSTDGSGTGAAVDLDFGIGAITVTDAGAGYSSTDAAVTFTPGSDATASIDILPDGEVTSKPAHTGWVLRTVGSGGRAGRIQTEVLVAGGISGDAADDDTYPE